MKNSIDIKAIWQELLEFLANDQEIGPVKANLWLSRINPISLENNVLTLEVPNTLHRHTVETRFEKKITSSIKDMLCLPEDISAVYIVSGESSAVHSENTAKTAETVSNTVLVSSANPKDNVVAESKVRIEPVPARPENNKLEDLFASQEQKRDARPAEDINTAAWQPSIVRNQAMNRIETESEATADPNALHPSFRSDLTFESFIEGPSNRFALGAAKAVVNERLSPLFIYSKPGLGKTHLLYAIAHGLYRKNPKVKILYTDAENYVNEFLRAIPENKTDAFREKYRNQDCFLIDDVQFLLGKERSVEEFFHTFKTFLDSKKLIVITSDKPPNEMALDERIMSRFRSGVIADIKLPDYETRVAILRQINLMNNYAIPIDVINFIAEKVHAGGRDLGGCLLTVRNFCMQTGARATVDIAQDLIRPMMSSQPAGPISIRTILKVVAEKYSLEIEDLVGSKRDQRFVKPRHIAMYLASELTDMTLEDIGKAFSRTHSLVITAKKNIEKELNEIYFNEHINEIIKKIKDVNNIDEK